LNHYNFELVDIFLINQKCHCSFWAGPKQPACSWHNWPTRHLLPLLEPHALSAPIGPPPPLHSPSSSVKLHADFFHPPLPPQPSSTVTDCYAASPFQPSTKQGARYHLDAHRPHLTPVNLLSSTDFKFFATLGNSATAVLPVNFIATGGVWSCVAARHRPLLLPPRHGQPSPDHLRRSFID
jgi:hypothetical protein